MNLLIKCAVLLFVVASFNGMVEAQGFAVGMKKAASDPYGNSQVRNYHLKKFMNLSPSEPIYKFFEKNDYYILRKVTGRNIDRDELLVYADFIPGNEYRAGILRYEIGLDSYEKLNQFTYQESVKDSEKQMLYDAFAYLTEVKDWDSGYTSPKEDQLFKPILGDRWDHRRDGGKTYRKLASLELQKLLKKPSEWSVTKLLFVSISYPFFSGSNTGYKYIDDQQLSYFMFEFLDSGLFFEYFPVDISSINEENKNEILTKMYTNSLICYYSSRFGHFKHPISLDTVYRKDMRDYIIKVRRDIVELQNTDIEVSRELIANMHSYVQSSIVPFVPKKESNIYNNIVRCLIAEQIGDVVKQPELAAFLEEKVLSIMSGRETSTANIINSAVLKRIENELIREGKDEEAEMVARLSTLDCIRSN